MCVLEWSKAEGTLWHARYITMLSGKAEQAEAA